jgi:hypothetical protein
MLEMRLGRAASSAGVWSPHIVAAQERWSGSLPERGLAGVINGNHREVATVGVTGGVSADILGADSNADLHRGATGAQIVGRHGSKLQTFVRRRVDLPVEGRVAPFQPLQDFALSIKELPVDAVVRRTGPLFIPLVDRQDRGQPKHVCQVLGREEDGPLIEGLGTHTGTLRMKPDSGADHHALVVKISGDAFSPVTAALGCRPAADGDVPATARAARRGLRAS